VVIRGPSGLASLGTEQEARELQRLSDPTQADFRLFETTGILIEMRAVVIGQSARSWFETSSGRVAQIVFALNCLATVSDYHIPHNHNISKIKWRNAVLKALYCVPANHLKWTSSIQKNTP
jgi:hypothetical protein